MLIICSSFIVFVDKSVKEKENFDTTIGMLCIPNK